MIVKPLEIFSVPCGYGVKKSLPLHNVGQKRAVRTGDREKLFSVLCPKGENQIQEEWANKSRNTQEDQKTNQSWL